MFEIEGRQGAINDENSNEYVTKIALRPSALQEDAISRQILTNLATAFPGFEPIDGTKLGFFAEEMFCLSRQDLATILKKQDFIDETDVSFYVRIAPKVRVLVSPSLKSSSKQGTGPLKSHISVKSTAEDSRQCQILKDKDYCALQIKKFAIDGEAYYNRINKQRNFLKNIYDVFKKLFDERGTPENAKNLMEYESYYAKLNVIVGVILEDALENLQKMHGHYVYHMDIKLNNMGLNLLSGEMPEPFGHIDGSMLFSDWGLSISFTKEMQDLIHVDPLVLYNTFEPNIIKSFNWLDGRKSLDPRLFDQFLIYLRHCISHKYLAYFELYDLARFCLYIAKPFYNLADRESEAVFKEYKDQFFLRAETLTGISYADLLLSEQLGDADDKPASKRRRQ